MKMDRIYFLLPTPESEQLTFAAAVRSTSRSDLLRDVVRKFLMAEPVLTGAAAPAVQTPPRPTMPSSLFSDDEWAEHDRGPDPDDKAA